MATLNGTSSPVSLGHGITIRAPGLRGTATAHVVGPGSTTRAPEVTGSSATLDQAMRDNGMHPLRVLDLSVARVPVPGGGPVRAPSGEPGFEVSVPDLGPDTAQVLLAVDEFGVATWNFPVNGAGASAPTTRGSGATLRFVVPAFAAPVGIEDPGTTTTRGVMGFVGKKILELIAIPLAELAAPRAVRAAAEHWERGARVCRMRSFTPDNYRLGQVADLDEAGWAHLSTGRSLLFVHGTFASAPGGFAHLPHDTMSALHDAYAGRVAAFDHFTLGVDPVENVGALGALVPAGLAGAAFEVDIVCHSRGGLVARALAGQAGESPLQVRRIVHVASANHGTALSSPGNVSAFIDRATTLVNLVPDGVLDVVTVTLSSILVVVKLIAKYGLPAVPGLASMDVAGDFLTGFNATPVTAVQYAVAADFSPSGPLLALATKTVANVVMDRVFDGAPNDLVVPTAGAYEGSAALDIPTHRRLVLPTSRGVNHSTFFGQPDVAAAIHAWLTEP